MLSNHDSSSLETVSPDKQNDYKRIVTSPTKSSPQLSSSSTPQNQDYISDEKASVSSPDTNSTGSDNSPTSSGEEKLSPSRTPSPTGSRKLSIGVATETMLEGQNEILEAQNQDLRKQLALAQTENQKLKQENTTLKKQIINSTHFGAPPGSAPFGMWDFIAAALFFLGVIALLSGIASLGGLGLMSTTSAITLTTGGGLGILSGVFRYVDPFGIFTQKKHDTALTSSQPETPTDLSDVAIQRKFRTYAVRPKPLDSSLIKPLINPSDKAKPQSFLSYLCNFLCCRPQPGKETPTSQGQFDTPKTPTPK